MENHEFDPNGAASHDSGIFGLPFTAEESQIIIIPVEWELTTSYNRGTANGPMAVFEASKQVDLYNHDYPELWKKGIWMDEFPAELRNLHESLIPASETIIEAAESLDLYDNPEKYDPLYKEIEDAVEKKNNWLKERIKFWKDKGKIVGLLGGDHSIPLAYHQYLNETKCSYGIVHIDAHSDLRLSFEGFKYSHASIFRNALDFRNITKLTQIAIRDYCEEERDFITSENGRISVFYDRDTRKRIFEGENWKAIVDEILSTLPERVYVSVDIDGLDPKLCPNTGTPVPGGLDYEELMYLLNRIHDSRKEIVGFDLCEVSPPSDSNNDWDGNVGARVLFQLCGMAT